MKKYMLLPVAALCLLFTACNDAGNGNNDANDTTLADRAENKVDEAMANMRETREENFVTNAIEDNAEEMVWLKAGVGSGTDAELKAHAQQMLGDHEKMDSELRAYAGKKNISLADLRTNETVNLNEKAGREWDEEWADEVGDMHRAVIRRFERAQNRVQDAELKDMINKSLPTLQAHRDMTQKLEDKLNK